MSFNPGRGGVSNGGGRGGSGNNFSNQQRGRGGAGGGRGGSAVSRPASAPSAAAHHDDNNNTNDIAALRERLRLAEETARLATLELERARKQQPDLPVGKKANSGGMGSGGGSLAPAPPRYSHHHLHHHHAPAATATAAAASFSSASSTASVSSVFSSHSSTLSVLSTHSSQHQHNYQHHNHHHGNNSPHHHQHPVKQQPDLPVAAVVLDNRQLYEQEKKQREKVEAARLQRVHQQQQQQQQQQQAMPASAAEIEKQQQRKREREERERFLREQRLKEDNLRREREAALERQKQQRRDEEERLKRQAADRIGVESSETSARVVVSDERETAYRGILEQLRQLHAEHERRQRAWGQLDEEEDQRRGAVRTAEDSERRRVELLLRDWVNKMKKLQQQKLKQQREERDDVGADETTGRSRLVSEERNMRHLHSEARQRTPAVVMQEHFQASVSSRRAVSDEEQRERGALAKGLLRTPAVMREERLRCEHDGSDSREIIAQNEQRERAVWARALLRHMRSPPLPPARAGGGAAVSPAIRATASAVPCTQPGLEVMRFDNLGDTLTAKGPFQQGDVLYNFPTKEQLCLPFATVDTICSKPGLHLIAVNGAQCLAHRCAPNTHVQVDPVTGDVSVVAMCGIAAGDVVSYNYLSTEWLMDAPFDCACGAPCCFGRIAGFSKQSEERQRQLLETGTVSPVVRALHEQQQLQKQNALPSSENAGVVPYLVHEQHPIKRGNIISPKVWLPASSLPAGFVRDTTCSFALCFSAAGAAAAAAASEHQQQQQENEGRCAPNACLIPIGGKHEKAAAWVLQATADIMPGEQVRVMPHESMMQN